MAFGVTDIPQKVVDGKNIIGLRRVTSLCMHGEVTGKMWNAGDNSDGQIGDGTNSSSQVKPLTEVTYFSSNNITINKVYAGGELYLPIRATGIIVGVTVPGCFW